MVLKPSGAVISSTVRCESKVLSFGTKWNAVYDSFSNQTTWNPGFSFYQPKLKVSEVLGYHLPKLVQGPCDSPHVSYRRGCLSSMTTASAKVQHQAVEVLVPRDLVKVQRHHQAVGLQQGQAEEDSQHLVGV